MTLNGLSDKELERYLALNTSTERLLTDHISNLPQSVRRDSVRKKQLTIFNEIANRSKIDLMVSAEKTYLQAELKDFADSATMKSSLRQGITNLEIIESFLDRVRDSDYYRRFDSGHLLPKSRRNGLPDDDARKSFRAHATRLTNLDKSRMDKTERSILEQRRKNIRVAEKIYITMQEAALGIKAGKTKDKGLGLE